MRSRSVNPGEESAAAAAGFAGGLESFFKDAGIGGRTYKRGTKCEGQSQDRSKFQTRRQAHFPPQCVATEFPVEGVLRRSGFPEEDRAAKRD
jgi:hypothetical protein